MWLQRNKVRLGDPLPDWMEISKCINLTVQKYWLASQKCNAYRRQQPAQTQWNPPLLGEIKINTVIAYDDLRATSGIVVRDHNGNVF